MVRAGVDMEWCVARWVQWQWQGLGLGQGQGEGQETAVVAGGRYHSPSVPQLHF